MQAVAEAAEAPETSQCYDNCELFQLRAEKGVS
jgi:hypothetical protein